VYCTIFGTRFGIDYSYWFFLNLAFFFLKEFGAVHACIILAAIIFDKIRFVIPSSEFHFKARIFLCGRSKVTAPSSHRKRLPNMRCTKVKSIIKSFAVPNIYQNNYGQANFLTGNVNAKLGPKRGVVYKNIMFYNKIIFFFICKIAILIIIIKICYK